MGLPPLVSYLTPAIWLLAVGSWHLHRLPGIFPQHRVHFEVAFPLMNALGQALARLSMYISH